MTLSVLVTGGAGYIGSHMVQMLQQAGHKTTVFDNLSRGFLDAVVGGEFVEGDLRKRADLVQLFAGRQFDVVMHFAALAYVGESVLEPRQYYENNVTGAQNLFNAMLDAGVNNVVFSSTCATYGVPLVAPIVENGPQLPVNPYGRTKLLIEGLLADYAIAYDLHSVSLRYFNAAGCDPDGLLGERHDPETHLIPLVLLEALRVQHGGNPADTALKVFGDDFDTPDGTCVRDYIHVTDLCKAHMLAMDRLCGTNGVTAEAYNLGNGNGFSVKEVIAACCRVTGVDIRYRVSDRRPGDPPTLVGSAEKAGEVLGWHPNYPDLDEIVATAWNWFQENKGSHDENATLKSKRDYS